MLKNLKNDEDLLRSFKNFSKNKIAVELANITNNVKNAVLGALLPSELEQRSDTDNIESIDIRGMPLLETEQDAAQRPKGRGLKIMTPKQMITRLPILLAQLKAGNNSQKLKSEIRQIAYSLYRSKNLSKTIYNNLIKTI